VYRADIYRPCRIPSFKNRKPDQLARTGLWLALAVFIDRVKSDYSETRGARKLIFKSAQ
jgi:hypothetical protein